MNFFDVNVFTPLDDNGVGVIGEVHHEPGKDGVPLPIRESEVNGANKTVTCVADRIDHGFGWSCGATKDWVVVIGDISLVVDERAMEFPVEPLFLRGHIGPGCKRQRHYRS